MIATTLLVAVLQQITVAGQPGQLDIRPAGDAAVRVTLKPLSFSAAYPEHPAVAKRDYGRPVLSLRSVSAPTRRKVGTLEVEVRPDPLTLVVRNAAGALLQRIVFEADGSLSFDTGNQPILGMGEGGPRPEQGRPWREQPVQFDRRGKFDNMEPRWQADMYGSRNPVAMLVGTAGWALYVPTPWVEVDLRDPARGKFIPWKPPETSGPQTERNQQQNLLKGRPPVDRIVPGLYDFFVFDAKDPAKLMKDYAAITGPAVLPPRWALGYMQSHRTLESDSQMLAIVKTFRQKQIPLDAVIYLGTGFTPRGWNKRQPSFEFNPEVFKRNPQDWLNDVTAQDVKVVVHMVPYDRDSLPNFTDEARLKWYWSKHEPLVRMGIDAFWPDEGDWFNLFERLRRHQFYYEGHLTTNPSLRPWSLQRNGYPGIAQWGGWVWSGDTDSSWKTLEAQIAVGINYSLSIGPYWGSDIGGFYPNPELTGELYARWFQMAAFNGSFRSHGRAWWTRLPWGWGLSELGPRETSNNNQPVANDDRRVPLASELNNPHIEPVAKKYAELRYQLMPYTYTLAWEARATGMPLQRALWLHYPNDEKARGVGDQFLWGRDLMIAPVYTKGATSRSVYLPAGQWYDWWDNSKVAGGATITRAVDLATMPIFVRAGAIIPFDPIRQYTAQPVSEPTTLRIYRGANGDFTLYDDDGSSQDYLQGKGTWIRLRWNDATRMLTLSPGPNSQPVRRDFKVQLMPGSEGKSVTYVGRTVSVKL